MNMDIPSYHILYNVHAKAFAYFFAFMFKLEQHVASLYDALQPVRSLGYEQALKRDGIDPERAKGLDGGHAVLTST
jgi:hypothetical protein